MRIVVLDCFQTFHFFGLPWNARWFLKKTFAIGSDGKHLWMNLIQEWNDSFMNETSPIYYMKMIKETHPSIEKLRFNNCNNWISVSDLYKSILIYMRDWFVQSFNLSYFFHSLKRANLKLKGYISLRLFESRNEPKIIPKLNYFEIVMV